MKSKGAVKFFAVALVLVSIFQLSFTFKTMMVEGDAKAFANGNEAIGYAALHAGVDFFAHYTGSPVNGVETHLKKLK
jgi:hypothetical protein